MSFRVFNELYREYDSWFVKEREKFLAEVNCFKRIISDARKPWLEIGVGSGRFAKELGIDFGVDPSEKMVEISRARGIRAILGYGEHLPFDSNYFGAVFIIVTICFVDNPLKVLRESHRVLRDDGYLYLGIIPKDSLLGLEYLHKKFHGHRFYKYASFYSLTELLRLASEAGFHLRKLSSAGINPPDFYCLEFHKV